MFFSAFKREARSPILWVVWAVLSLFVATMGPFGSYGVVSFVDRLAFWAPFLGFGILVSAIVRAIVFGVFSQPQMGLGSFVTALTIATVLAPPLYGLVWARFAGEFPMLPGFGEIWAVIFCVSQGVCALRIAQAGPEPEPAAPETATTALIAQPRLAGRLDPGMRGALLSISVRDHYVDVRTDKGAASLLMRLADAISEAEPTDGAQVHRSHWVAWDAVQSVEKQGDKVVLHLKDGAPIPVSRNYRDKLSQRGLI